MSREMLREEYEGASRRLGEIAAHAVDDLVSIMQLYPHFVYVLELERLPDLDSPGEFWELAEAEFRRREVRPTDPDEIPHVNHIPEGYLTDRSRGSDPHVYHPEFDGDGGREGGVYPVWVAAMANTDSLLYVGETGNLFKRLSEHFTDGIVATSEGDRPGSSIVNAFTDPVDVVAVYGVDPENAKVAEAVLANALTIASVQPDGTVSLDMVERFAYF